MDPLSVTASVVGLLSAAGKVFTLLEGIASAEQCPAVVGEARGEISLSQIALRSLQRYLGQLDLLSPQRAALIQVDELRVTLADAMLAFSSFESLLELLSGLARFRVVIAWARYSRLIEEHVRKTQRFKTSLILMMGILQCESDMEASRKQARLQTLVEGTLEENQKLKQLLQLSEDSFDARSTFTRRQGDNSTLLQRSSNTDGTDAVTIRECRFEDTATGNISVGGMPNIPFDFENVLEQSWAYRRNEQNECDISFISTDQRSHAWSVFAGFSLSDISALSVIAMPLTLREIANLQHYTAKLNKEELTSGNNLSIATTDGQSLRARGEFHADAGESLSERRQELADQSDLDSTNGTSSSSRNSDVDSVISSSPPCSSISSEATQEVLVRALHRYQATVEGQATVAKGDIMVVLDDSHGYWWLIRLCSENTIGYIPAEFVETQPERVARWNKHQNQKVIDPEGLSAGGQNKPQRRSTDTATVPPRKRVTFADEVTFIEHVDEDYSIEVPNTFELHEQRSTFAPQRKEQQLFLEANKKNAHVVDGFRGFMDRKAMEERMPSSLNSQTGPTSRSQGLQPIDDAGEELQITPGGWI